MDKLKITAISLLLAVVFVTSVTYAYYMGQQTALTTVQTQEKPPITGYVRYWVKRAGSDEWQLIDENPNIVVTIGLKYLRNVLGFANASWATTNQTVYISVSNDASPSASWTKLPNEITGSGLARSGPDSGYPQVINATAYKTMTTFTASAEVTVQCSGLHWSPTSNSDGNLFAANTFTQTTLYANDQLKIEWTINLQSGS